MTHRHFRRTLLLTAAVIPMAITALAQAQYRIDNGAARDASNRVGSGGFNDRGSDVLRTGGLAGNYIVTGNVTAGRSFRGSVGYTDPSAFRGSLGSASLDTFIRDSVSASQVRGSYGQTNIATIQPQPFFGAGRTVAPPAGFVRDYAAGGYMIPTANPGVRSNDARLDYGGANRSQIAQGVLDQQRIIGGAGLGTTGFGQMYGNDRLLNAARRDAMQVSEYTTLARNTGRPGIFSGSAANDQALERLRTQVSPQAELTTADERTRRDGRPDTQADRENATNVGGIDPARPNDPFNLNRGTGGAFNQDAAQRDGAPASPGLTGQSTSRRNLRAIENNSQYAELRQRFEERNRMPQLPGQDATDQIRQTNAQVLAQREKEKQSQSQPKPADNRQQAQPNPGAATPGGPAATPGAAPGTGVPDAPKPTPDAIRTPGTPDALQLPRPQAEAPTGVAPRPVAPLQIKSLSTGVKDQQLSKLLAQAETQMKDGKFSSAIDAFDRAEELAQDDPLVFIGRGIAELGGSYYRNAEVHIRQALAADRALLGAKFDLRNMLSNERLEFLQNDLGEVANTNPKDPGPLVLLAFIYYNTGMEERAAKALEMAQQRAGDRDEVIKLLQQNWVLTPTAPNAQTEMNK